MAITATTLRLTEQLRRSLLKVTDQQTRDLVAAWADAWDGIAGDLELAILDLAARAEDGRITRAQMLRSDRLTAALGSIARSLTRLADQAGVRIVADLPGVVEAAARAQAAIVDSQLPKAGRDHLPDWSGANDRQLEAIVQRSTEQIASDLWPLSSEAQGVIRRELVRGVAAGRNPRETAARMVKNTEGGFNGGLTRALTIARTETISAHREAAAVSHAANADVLAGWIWLTDLRVSPPPCPACLGMSGTEHPLIEPGPLGHQNCRCSRMPKTKSWAELGIEGIEEPESALPDAGEWFASQDEAVQRSILGPARYDAWLRGDYPMKKWATKVHNPDWRPSYQTSKLPSLSRKPL